MILAAIGMSLATMVGPLDEGQVVRISRPGGAGPEFVRTLAVGQRDSRGGVVVPSSSVAGGGAVTVVGGSEGTTEETFVSEEPTGIYTEQLMRAFGYDRSHYGFSVIDYSGGRGGRWGGGWHAQDRPRAPVDPRILSSLRDLVPIEAKFPPVPGR